LSGSSNARGEASSTTVLLCSPASRGRTATPSGGPRLGTARAAARAACTRPTGCGRRTPCPSRPQATANRSARRALGQRLSSAMQLRRRWRSQPAGPPPTITTPDRRSGRPRPSSSRLMTRSASRPGVGYALAEPLGCWPRQPPMARSAALLRLHGSVSLGTDLVQSPRCPDRRTRDLPRRILVDRDYFSEFLPADLFWMAPESPPRPVQLRPTVPVRRPIWPAYFKPAGVGTPPRGVSATAPPTAVASSSSWPKRRPGLVRGRRRRDSAASLLRSAPRCSPRWPWCLVRPGRVLDVDEELLDLRAPSRRTRLVSKA